MVKYLLGVVIICGCFLALPVWAEEKLQPADSQPQITKKSEELKKIEAQISEIEEKSSQLSAKYELAKKENKGKKDAYEKAKDTYTRSSQNVDLVTPEQLAHTLSDYKKADNELRASDNNLKEIANEKQFTENEFKRLKEEKTGKEIEILEIKAKAYEDNLRQGVWVEGAGECILDENRTMKECSQLALDYAKRDAVEKGGKSLIETVTKVEMFQLTKDEIKTTGKVNIIDQDNSGDFGKVKKIVSGDIIKFTAKVRLKVQSVDIYNPYRERIKELQGATPTADKKPEEEAAKEKDIEELKKRLESLEQKKQEHPAIKEDSREEKKTKTKKQETKTKPFVPLPGF